MSQDPTLQPDDPSADLDPSEAEDSDATEDCPEHPVALTLPAGSLWSVKLAVRSEDGYSSIHLTWTGTPALFLEDPARHLDQLWDVLAPLNLEPSQFITDSPYLAVKRAGFGSVLATLRDKVGVVEVDRKGRRLLMYRGTRLGEMHPAMGLMDRPVSWRRCWAMVTLRDKNPKGKEEGTLKLLIPEAEVAGMGMGMGIGGALEAMESGSRVARAGWNGRGMYLYLVEGASTPAEVFVEPFVMMKTAQGGHVPWLCSQADLLARDWEVVPQ
jgi:hypothetical protein